jgi:hypothetical protein
MPIASCSNPQSATLECTTVEIIDDILVSYPTHALTQLEDLASESLHTGERETLVVESFGPAGNPDRLQVRPTRTGKISRIEERISMNSEQTKLPISILCRPITMILGLMFFAVMSVSPARAQITTTTADIVDWDLPSLQGAGMCPSAIGAVTLPPSGDPVYYVTRGACPSISPNNLGRSGPVMLRFIPGNPLATGQASWRAWNLGGPIEDTGGMKITRDARYAFVRAAREIVRVNMTNNVLTHWVDFADTLDPVSWSDLALVERCGGYIDVYSAHTNPTGGGIIERLTVQNGSNNATVKRWDVGGGAGSEFLSGVAYNSGNGKIYFSEGASNNIGELDPNTNKVRRWNLSAVTAATPRQISIDTKGIVWIVTGSGHLVSLNPCSNDMAAYLIPGAGAFPSPGPDAIPFGIGTSGGIVGFTEAGGKKVGVLIPNKQSVPVTPSCLTATFTCDSIAGTPECINADYGNVTPQSKPGQPALHTDIDPVGEFIEATLPDTGNFPLGIFRDIQRCVGNFYLVVELGGVNANGNDHRLSHVAFDLSGVTSLGLVTGGGTIRNIPSAGDQDQGEDDDDWDSDSDGGVFCNFGFNFYRKNALQPVRGQLNYQNKTTGEHVKSVQITDMQIVGNTATISGTCTNNGLPCTFQLTVQDNGNPGKGKDTFQISGAGIVPNGGTLSGGNIKVRQ